MKVKATSLSTLRRRSNTSSIRILGQVVKEVCAALPESLRAFAEDADLCEQWIEDGDYSFPSLQVTLAVGDWHEGAGQLLALRTPPPGHISGLWENGNIPSVRKGSEPLWRGLKSRGGPSSLVQTLPRKAAGGACTSCPWRSDSRIPVEDFARGDSHKQRKGVHTLLNFVSGAAKLAIWLTHRNRVQGVGSVVLLPVLQELLRARLRVEHTYYHLIDKVQAFRNMWAVGGECPEFLCRECGTRGHYARECGRQGGRDRVRAQAAVKDKGVGVEDNECHPPEKEDDKMAVKGRNVGEGQNGGTMEGQNEDSGVSKDKEGERVVVEPMGDVTAVEAAGDKMATKRERIDDAGS
ncbi:hypothetical protein NHX12_012733 [Muraenolepis orangiensis]|uniref:CCHC-type domain-containing protein n=1 Tax=Muraenolepis orangiensis TaxID=630683 RepID=A0A9Q0I667_9TELE|nr:hypothetical protein NHX12_012733 [Muraenolepis orangiensis]